MVTRILHTQKNTIPTEIHTLRLTKQTNINLGEPVTLQFPINLPFISTNNVTGDPKRQMPNQKFRGIWQIRRAGASAMVQNISHGNYASSSSSEFHPIDGTLVSLELATFIRHPEGTNTV